MSEEEKKFEGTPTSVPAAKVILPGATAVQRDAKAPETAGDSPESQVKTFGVVVKTMIEKANGLPLPNKEKIVAKLRGVDELLG